MKGKSFSKITVTFLVFAVLAFILRSIYFSQTIKFIHPGVASDGYFYLQWAKDIARGNLLGRDVFYALPLYPYFLSLVYLFSAGEIFDLILIQALIGSINCGLIYILGRKLFNNQVGMIAAFIACVYSMFIFYDRMLLPTSLSISLGLVLALLLLRTRDNPSLKKWFGAGLLLGLCTLARASFFPLVILILFWIVYEYKRDTLKHVLSYCFCFILPFFLIIGGVTLRNYLVADDAVLITAHSGINFYIGNNPEGNGLFKTPPYMRATQSGLIEDAKILAEQISGKRLKPSEISNFWTRRSLSFIISHPLDYLRLLGKKIVLFWNGKEHIDDIEYYIFNEEAGLLKLPLFNFSLIGPLGILGMFLSWPQRKRIILLYLFVFGLTLATILFFINARYRLIFVPYLLIFAANALWQTFQKCKNRQYKNFIFSLVLFLALYFLTNIKVTNASSSANYTFHYNKGVILCDQGQYQKAEQQFQTALKINPHDFMSYLGLGNVYYQMEEFEQAINSYQKSLAINPYFYKAHFNSGIIYKERGKKKEAEEEFKKVLRLWPQDCAAHYNLGRIYQEKGLMEAALKEYTQALEIKPGHQEILQAIDEVSEQISK